MSEKRIQDLIRRYRQPSVDFDINPYKKVLEDINAINLKNHTDLQLKVLSRQLIEQARSGTALQELLVKAFSLVREACDRVLKMRPFDVQVMAGVAMHFRALAEMQTGEGKTLTAVMPVYLNALTGKGAHVLTFNDYLAKRDAEWMGPVYKYLGLSVGYVSESMSLDERRNAYFSDVTYLTAKEAGFDFLKSFLCTSPEQLVQRPFHFALVDEADSILIDEARIPLVIAGRTRTERPEPRDLADIVRDLTPGRDYQEDEYERNVFLTDKGIMKLENLFKCGNLYEEKNISLLVDINNALHAEVMLKRDIDYIVRNGKIELVDEFTGRIADKRHWPHGLQEAIEAKEGIAAVNKGQILASITLQNFIKQYPLICGMTGTAQTAAEEFAGTYGLKVVVVPTNKPCIRADNPDITFTHKEAKYKALVEEIMRVHSAGRPLLIGTASVEESEMLAGKLLDKDIKCSVLNAKNDELEASIIARAGEYGAITVSTNMAGRGTDIKLGGSDEHDRDRIVSLGGLCVIGTNKHESRRIDNQLRGRAGRQGDPGSTMFYASLEDDLMLRYKLKELIPKAVYPKNQNKPIDNRIITREAARAQRIVEGQNFEIRKTLGKYNIVIEQERQRIYDWRQCILLYQGIPGLFKSKLPERYEKLTSLVGERGLFLAERQVAMYYINKCWADYLDFISYVRESIHLVNVAGKVPVDEFNRTAINSFEHLQKEIEEEIVNTLERAEVTANGVDMEKEGLKQPTSTWTYLVNDSPEQLGIMPMIGNVALIPTHGAILLAMGIWNRFFRYKHKE